MGLHRVKEKYDISSIDLIYDLICTKHKCKKLTKEEYSQLDRKYYANPKQRRESDMRELKYQYEKKQYNKNTIVIRDYQQNAIDEGLHRLNTTKKFYLELATSGGKSLIIYNIFQKIEPKNIIIFSPLKKINQQNVKDDYINTLSNEYKIVKYPEDNIAHNSGNIISSCIQSYKRLYCEIIKRNINNITVWFDESHWGVEGWLENLDEKHKKFWLTDTTFIVNRIFTTASPNKDYVCKNYNIFGSIYNPISTSKLIIEKWLCDMKVYVYEQKKQDIGLINTILQHFKDNNKSHGFSFHNECKNAFNLFTEHYKLYKQNKTNIKPFLLINNEFRGKNKDQINSIELDYVFTDIHKYENNENCIGYIVKCYSIGYDFNKIDFIVFSDPKMSYSDIIQCIGRGLRPDGKGINRCNLEKILHILLPIFNDGSNKYEDIKEVLLYLINEIELDYKDIKFINRIKKPNIKESGGKNYIGIESVKTIYLDIMKEKINKWSYNDLKKYLISQKIYNESKYNELRSINKSLPSFLDLIQKYRKFCFRDLHPQRNIWYETKEEAVKASKDIKNIMTDEEKEEYDYSNSSEQLELLNTKNNKIPLINFDLYYPKDY